MCVRARARLYPWRLSLRAEYCDIRINLLSVSREHAELVVDEKDQVWVNALSTSSDTNVAKKPVTGKILLQDNDLIEIGQRQFIFHRNFDAPGSAKVCSLPASA